MTMGFSRHSPDEKYPPLTDEQRRGLHALIGAETRCEIHRTRPAVACVNGIACCHECDVAVPRPHRKAS